MDGLTQQIFPEPLVRCLVALGIGTGNTSEGKGRAVHYSVALEPVSREDRMPKRRQLSAGRSLAIFVFNIHMEKPHV